jgi:hypothetical protein
MLPSALRAEVAIAALRRGALLCGVALLVAGCGMNKPTQDANEPSGEFPVRVEASFPEEQKLAQDSRLEIEVENVGDGVIPNANVHVEGFSKLLRDPSDPARIDPQQADPERPIFVINKSPIEFERDRSPVNQSLVDREIDPPSGKRTAYVSTYSLGELAPGDTAVFRWNLSAIDPGPYKLSYEVNAGLDGRAKAVDEDGERPTGEFAGVIQDSSPAARVAGDGETVVTSDGRRIEDQRGIPRSDD